MAVSLKTDLRFPESGQHGHGSRIIHESLLNSGVNKQWVALPAYKNICPSLTVDMKKLEIIPLSKVIMDIKELKENNTYLRICSVDSPFREQIIWNYMQTSCRPGVPDRNVTAWAKDIANIKK